MTRRLRDLLRAPLRAAGLDVVRYTPNKLPEAYHALEALGLKTVIDVGAHEGEFARTISMILPDLTLIAFEPQPEQFARLRAAPPRVASFTAFNCALGDRASAGRMHRGPFTQTSSLLPMALLHTQVFPEASVTEAIDVDIRTLDDALTGIDLKPGILLKLDVQGFEDRVILGGLGTIAQTCALLIEVSFHELYEGQLLFDGIYKLVTRLGFECSGVLEQLLDRDASRILSADVLFLRSPTKLATPPADAQPSSNDLRRP